MPTLIKLNELDAAIRQAIQNFNGGKLPGAKGPIINGIIINEPLPGKLRPINIARDITAAIKVPEGVVLKPTVTRISDRKVIVGFKIQQP